MTRTDILEKAKICVNGSRENDYGSPEDSFNAIAGLWTTYISAAFDEFINFEAKDIAAMLALLKIARIASGKKKDDNWIDLAGYAACGGEIQSSKE